MRKRIFYPGKSRPHVVRKRASMRARLRSKNLDGLVALKNKYDATDFFRMNQNVKRASVYPTEALRRSDKWRFSKQ
jgi:hypothetical protein